VIVGGSACGSILWNKVNLSGWRYADTGLPTDAGLLCDITTAVLRDTVGSGPCRPCCTYVPYTTYLLTQCHWYRCAGWLHVGVKYTVIASLGLRRFQGNLIFVWPCIINVGKVIQKNQLDATIIYWSIRSTQHVSGNLLPIIRRVRLRFLQHMVTCCCGGQGDGERQRGT